MSRADVFLRVAWKNYGQPYMWGGDDPVAGFDCSGFVIECLKSVGLLPPKGDWTAENLRKKYAAKSPHPGSPRPTLRGDIVFYLRSNGTARHVEICTDGIYNIGASGGGSKNVTVQDAIDSNAFIKVRPWSYRGEPVECYAFDAIG